jgi:hypothetical protein
MVNYNLPLYQNKPEVWDAKQCEKAAKRTVKDGMGTPYPFKGYLNQPSPHGWLDVRYNGGCTIDGKWWQGEHFPFPILAEGYEIVYVSTWGYRIKRTDTQKDAKK